MSLARVYLWDWPSVYASNRYISANKIGYSLVPQLLFIKKSINFWNITPCNPLSVNRRFWGTYRLTLKVEAICSSETSVDTQRITLRYIPEVDTLHNHRCENLNSYMFFTKIILTLWDGSLTASVTAQVTHKCHSTSRHLYNAFSYLQFVYCRVLWIVLHVFF
jgi:hypothetical protein